MTDLPPTDYARLQTTNKIKMVEFLGQDGIEGYTEKFVVPSDSSGATIGNGIDLGKWDSEGLKRAGVAPFVLDKINALGVLGLNGEAAKTQIEKIQDPSYDRLTSGEVINLANQVTQYGMLNIVNKLGAPKWNALPDGVKAVATSLYHQYGSRFYNQKAWKQIKSGDFTALKTNMENFGDRTRDANGTVNKTAAAINGRHNRVSRYIQTEPTLPIPTVPTNTGIKQ